VCASPLALEPRPFQCIIVSMALKPKQLKGLRPAASPFRLFTASRPLFRPFFVPFSSRDCSHSMRQITLKIEAVTFSPTYHWPDISQRRVRIILAKNMPPKIARNAPMTLILQFACDNEISEISGLLNAQNERATVLQCIGRITHSKPTIRTPVDTTKAATKISIIASRCEGCKILSLPCTARYTLIRAH
jgi:hypothetical protein